MGGYWGLEEVMSVIAETLCFQKTGGFWRAVELVL